MQKVTQIQSRIWLFLVSWDTKSIHNATHEQHNSVWSDHWCSCLKQLSWLVLAQFCLLYTLLREAWKYWEYKIPCKTKHNCRNQMIYHPIYICHVSLSQEMRVNLSCTNFQTLSYCPIRALCTSNGRISWCTELLWFYRKFVYKSTFYRIHGLRLMTMRKSGIHRSNPNHWWVKYETFWPLSCLKD